MGDYIDETQEVEVKINLRHEYAHAAEHNFCPDTLRCVYNLITVE